MNTLSSNLLGINPATELAKATQSSNTRAEYIAQTQEDKKEKFTALNTSAEINATQTQAPQSIEELQKTEQPKTTFTTQQIAHEEQISKPSSYQTAVAEFQEYMNKTPEERWFEAFLKEQGLTKEEFDALSPEEKQKLMDKFEDYVKAQIEEAEAKRLQEEKQ